MLREDYHSLQIAAPSSVLPRPSRYLSIDVAFIYFMTEKYERESLG